MTQDYVTVVACGNPNCTGQGGKPLRKEFHFQTPRPDIDVYNMFVDEFAKTGAYV